MNTAILKFIDTEDDNEVITYYVKKDDNFDNKIIELEHLVANYESYQDIEDFISENFEKVSIDTYDFEY